MGRRPKQHGPRIDGLLVVDKPVGPSSMDVVRRVRSAALGCRTGHAGTLDPLASGVLICCLGRATRCVEKLMGQSKRYVTEIDLSAFTTTDDREGARDEISVASPPSRERIEALLPRFTGTIQQRPPVYSALKVGGRPAYELARRGEAPQLAERTVRIDRIAIDRYEWPLLAITVDCGRGPYIRRLARAIGTALGTGGHLHALCRSAIGDYRIDDAIALDAIPRPLTEAQLLPIPH